LKKSGNQIILGNYADDVTYLGTAGQVGLGLLGLDLPADIRDILADIDHWEWSWSHTGQTIVDIVALVPGVGVVKYTDEVATLIKNGDEAAALLKGTLKTIPDIIPNKGFSSFSDLKNYLGSPGQGNIWHHFVNSHK